MKNWINTKKYFWIIVLSLSVFSCKPEINSVEIASPDSNFVFNLELEEGLNYSGNWYIIVVYKRHFWVSEENKSKEI